MKLENFLDKKENIDLSVLSNEELNTLIDLLERKQGNLNRQIPSQKVYESIKNLSDKLLDLEIEIEKEKKKRAK